MSIRSWWKRSHLDEDDFRAEVRAHLAIAARQKQEDGAGPADARDAALREFGNVTRTTEATRRVWMPRWMELAADMVSDVRYALRGLARTPAFTAAVVGVLTIGIGLNATVFTMLKALAFSPLAGVARSAQLVTIFGTTAKGRAVDISYPDYRYLRDHDRAFSGLFGSTVAPLNLGKGQESRQVFGEMVSGNYFQVLGVGATEGRTLLPLDEEAPGRNPVVVMSSGLWRRDYGAAPDIVGRTLTVNNVALTVVGVADPAFHGTTVVYDVDLYLPITMAPQLGFRFGSTESTPAAILADRRAAVFEPQGFLRPHTSLAAAAAQTDAMWTALARDRPLADPTIRLEAVTFWRSPGGAPSILLPTLAIISVMGLLVLLIACANLAGLVLVRGVSRRGEIAVRQALGASRVRILRLLIVENLVLAIPGAVLGVILAEKGVPLLAGYAERLAAPSRLFFNVGVDAIVMAFAVLVGCGSALVFGFVPAVRASRVDLVSVINEDASPRGAARSRLRGSLVVAQVAVSLLLLVGASLAMRSVDAARRANPGFDARHVTAISLDLEQNAYDPAQGRAFYRRLLQTVRAQPGVDSATLAASDPLSFLEPRADPVTVDGYTAARGEDLAFLSNTIAPDYFRTLRIPVIAGREFDVHDDETSEPVVVVNATFAARFWGGADHALGKRIRVGKAWRTIVGVAGDVKYVRINENPRPYFYLPFQQSYRPRMILNSRGPVPEDQLVEGARTAVARLDPNLRIVRARLLADGMRGALFLFDLAAAMLSVFGVAGLILAALGAYGLVSYWVRQSTREIGIRMALGATAFRILRTFVGRGVWLGGVGAALGLLAALAASGIVRTIVFGVSATDPVSFIRALAVVLGGVLVAALVPAWRAARTDPVTALRHQ